MKYELHAAVITGITLSRNKEKTNLLLLSQTPSLLVIMGCSCCKQKKSDKSAAIHVTDLSPSNADGGLSAALTQGRYCPDPTQTIPDFNKGFSCSTIFPNANTQQQAGGITCTFLFFLIWCKPSSKFFTVMFNLVLYTFSPYLFQACFSSLETLRSPLELKMFLSDFLMIHWQASGTELHLDDCWSSAVWIMCVCVCEHVCRWGSHSLYSSLWLWCSHRRWPHFPERREISNYQQHVSTSSHRNNCVLIKSDVKHLQLFCG